MGPAMETSCVRRGLVRPEGRRTAKRAIAIVLLLPAALVLFATAGASSARAAQMGVPLWSQQDPRWSALHLGGGAYTMAGSGCAVTCCAMVAAYFGSEKDPGELCRSLGANGGLDSQGRMYWEKVPSAAGGTIIYVGRWDYAGTADLARINAELDADYPVIAEVSFQGSSHYVVLTGREGSTYRMNDPGYAGETTLNARYGSPAAVIRGIRLYHGQHGAAPAPDQRFVDVFPSDPYYAAIQALAGSDIEDGYLQVDGTARFLPDASLLRAQFAKIICKAAGLTVTEALETAFTDLGPNDPKDLYPHDYIAAATNAGIIQGKTPVTFDPWSGVTRAQVLTMIVRTAQSLFPDTLLAPPATYVGTLVKFDVAHDENIRIAAYNGLLQGVVGFGPTWWPWVACSRREVAQILHNWLVKVEPGPSR